MREIKFRAWNKKDNKMYLVTGIYFSNKFVICGSKKFAYWSTRDSNIELFQFTGLKDKKGKEIYEGDIVKYNGYYAADKKPHNMYVEYNDNQGIRNWNGGAFVLKEKNSKGSIRVGDLLSNGSKCFIEVIGNIYENKDLLVNRK